MHDPSAGGVRRLDGERVLRAVEQLRPAAGVEAAEELVEAVEASLPELKVFMPFAHVPQTVDQQYERLVGVQRDYWANGDKVFLMWEGELLVACFGLHRRTLNTAGYEVGFWVRSSAAAQGLGTVGTRTLVQLCFDHLGCDRVQLLHSAANQGSRVIAQRSGFQVEGQLRRFTTEPTAAMLADGASAEPVTVITSLVRDDVAQLGWYESHRALVDVYDWRGVRITPA